jgi:hypothetical protein
MASIFEAPPKASPSRFPSGLAQLGAAFAAGIVVAVAIARPGTAPPEKVPPGPPAGRSTAANVTPMAPAKRAALDAPRAAQTPEVVTPPPPPSAGAAAPPVRAEAPSLADAKKSADTAKPTACNRGQWPYLDAGCGESDANTGEKQKSIRVIGVDQTAPANIVAEPKPQPETVAPKSVETKTESVAAPTPAAATPSMVTSTNVAPSAQPGDAASAQTGFTAPVTATPIATMTAAVAPSAPPAPELTPIPPSDPRTKAKAEKPRKPKQRATVQREATRPDASERNTAKPEQSTKQNSERDEVAERQPRREDADRQPRREGADRQYRRDDGDRASRRAEAEDRNEADGFSLVRRHVLPDGRRVTVYRKYDNDGSAPRRPSSRSPFGSLFGEPDDGVD